MSQSHYNIIFCGTPEFAIPSLQALLSNPHCTVTAVVTQPDRPVGRKQVLTAPPVKTVAVSHGIPVLQPERLTLNDIKQYPCDFLVVVAYGQLLKAEVLEYPTIAPVNVHASLLPRWRGASPIQASIAAGDSETGITIQYMAQKLDAGAILHQVHIPITSATTSSELFTTLATLGATALVTTLTSPLHPVEQNEALVTHCGKLTREDGTMDPLQVTAEHIERLHRAYFPWPGVTLRIQNTPVKLHACSLTSASGSKELHCKDNTVLYVSALQLAGEPVKTASSVLSQLHV